MFCGVPSCSIENKNDSFVNFAQALKEFHCCDGELSLDEFVVEFSVERVRAVHVRVLCAAIHVNNRRFANWAPATSFVSVSSEMRFIYADDCVIGRQREGLPLEVFLKVRTAFSSRFLCSGRGTFHDILSS